MNILDTFFILFKSDTSDLKKGQKEADKTTSDLKDKLKTTNQDAIDLGESFVDLAQKAAGFIGIALGVGAAVKGIMAAEQGALNVGFFSDSTGIAVGRVDALTQAVQRFGGTTESTFGTLKKIQDGLTFFTPLGGAGGGAPMPTAFSLAARQFGLRVAPGMSVGDVLDQIHNRFKNQTPSQNLKIGAALGLDEATIRMLQTSDDEYAQIKKSVADIGLLTEQNTKAAEEFYRTWGDINQSIRQTELIIGTNILNFFNKLPDLISQNAQQFHEMGEAAKIVAGIVGFLLIPAILEMIVVAAPVILLAAAFAGLYLIIHKFGDPSTWGWVKTLSTWVDHLTTGLGRVMAYLYEISQGDFKAAKDVWSGDPNEDAKKLNTMKEDYQRQEQQLRAARGAITGANSSPFSSSPGATSKSTATTITIGKIEVHTQATDAEGIASAVGGHLEKQMNGAINNFNTAVLA